MKAMCRLAIHSNILKLYQGDNLMQILTLLCEKGGVGKTTIAVNVAADLACRYHQRVLLVDADAQGHATISLQLPKQPGIYDLLVRDADWRNVLMLVPDEVRGGSNGSLAVLPSNVETRSIPNAIDDAFKLDTRLRQLSSIFDWVVIDTPPTPSLLHASILLATDAVLLPTQLEKYSVAGVMDSLNRLSGLDNRRVSIGLPPVQRLGIVPNMFQTSTNEHRENLKQMQDRYGTLIWQPVYRRIVWAEASNAGLPVFAYDKHSPAANEAHALCDSVWEAAHGQTR